MKAMKRAIAGALLCLATAAVATTAAAGPYRPKTERGALAYAIVAKRGPEVARRYRMDIGDWARRLGPALAHAPLAQLREAAAAPSLDAMISVLNRGAPAPPARGTRSGEKLFGELPESLFVPIVACRLMDTRVANLPFTAGSVRQVSAYGTILLSQGVNPAGCGIPSTGVTAIVISITAVNPSGAGYATAYPVGYAGLPTAASVNYAAGEIVNNQTVVGMVYGGFSHESFFLYSYAATHMVVDVVGYYRKGEYSYGQLRCSDVSQTESIATSAGMVGVACPFNTTMTQIMCNAGDDPNPAAQAYAWKILPTPSSQNQEGACWYKGTGTVTTGARCCQQTFIR